MVASILLADEGANWPTLKERLKTEHSAVADRAHELTKDHWLPLLKKCQAEVAMAPILPKGNAPECLTVARGGNAMMEGGWRGLRTAQEVQVMTSRSLLLSKARRLLQSTQSSESPEGENNEAKDEDGKRAGILEEMKEEFPELTEDNVRWAHSLEATWACLIKQLGIPLEHYCGGDEVEDIGEVSRWLCFWSIWYRGFLSASFLWMSSECRS